MEAMSMPESMAVSYVHSRHVRVVGVRTASQSLSQNRTILWDSSAPICKVISRLSDRVAGVVDAAPDSRRRTPVPALRRGSVIAGISLTAVASGLVDRQECWSGSGFLDQHVLVCPDVKQVVKATSTSAGLGS